MDDGFDEISDDELPIEYKYGQSRDKIESIEFEFRVYFTGNKVVYKIYGTRFMRVIRIKRANVHCQAAFLCDSFHTALKHKLRHKILCPVCIGHPVGCSKEIRRDVQGLITCFNNTCCLIFYL